jgi:hypothetical protein
MDHAITRMQPCIDACTECHHMCLQTAMTHCLQLGGKHIEPGHLTLMFNCAEICQASANLQLSGSDFVPKLCALCAEVCEACATSCEAIGDMDECAAACRKCAESCAGMAVV